MLIEPLPIAGAFRIRIQPVADNRGFFARTFDKTLFAEAGIVTYFVQGAVSFNEAAGTLRGLHFQRPPHEEAKLVRCTRGAAFDVLVDLRTQSPTFGKWHGEEISAVTGSSLYLPAGVAHGFQTLVDETELTYQITPSYVPGASAGIRWDDPELGIAWPLRDHITISDRDRALPLFSEVIRDHQHR